MWRNCDKCLNKVYFIFGGNTYLFSNQCNNIEVYSMSYLKFSCKYIHYATEIGDLVIIANLQVIVL